jgi:hypothetical protein
VAKKIFEENRFLLSRLTSIFHLYLSVNQTIELNGDFIRFSLEKLYASTAADDDQLNPFLIRNVTEPLAIFDDRSSLTNLSRSNSLVFLDEQLNEMRWNDSREFFIFRDPTFDLPPLIEQNVTANPTSDKQDFFDLSHLNDNLIYSIHLELSTQDTNLFYLIVYQFNSRSLIKDLKLIDGWKTFCSNGTSSNFTLMIASFPRSQFHSILFAIRQLNRGETIDLCLHQSPPTSFANARSFSSNYFLRVYLSGCFYLDNHQRWKSHELIEVGPLTDHHRTHCLSPRH